MTLLPSSFRRKSPEGIKGALTSSKKRKSDTESSDDDLNVFDLKDFNYEDMENLKIDSNDDISV